MKLMRRWMVGVVATVGIAAVAAGARADETMWRSFRGRVVFTDIALAPESTFENAALMTPALKRLERSTIDQTAGFWRIHVLAFLDRPSATRSLVSRLRNTSPTDRTTTAADRLTVLTERELEVAVCVGRGLSNSEIASELYLSIPTVKSHVSRLLTKLDATNRVQVAMVVHDAGLV